MTKRTLAVLLKWHFIEANSVVQVLITNLNRLKTNSFQMIRKKENFCSSSYQYPYINCQACTMRIQSETYYRIKGSNSAYGIKKRYYSCGKNAGVRAQTLYNSVGVMLAHASCINKFTHRTPRKNSTSDLTRIQLLQTLQAHVRWQNWLDRPVFRFLIVLWITQ